jgi:hypothetical protein
MTRAIDVYDKTTSLDNAGGVSSHAHQCCAVCCCDVIVVVVVLWAPPTLLFLFSNLTDAAEAINDKGNIERSLELTAAACASYNRALEIRQRCLPPDHPDVAESLFCLALLKSEDEEEYEVALGLHERQLVILNVALGTAHPDTLACHDAMGVRDRFLSSQRSPRCCRFSPCGPWLAVTSSTFPQLHPLCCVHTRAL